MKTAHPAGDPVVLTGNHLSISDKDTDPSDIQLTVKMTSRTSGKLQRYDHLTNSERTLRPGDVFYYQDVLEGDVLFLAGPDDDDVISLQVTDGDFKEDVQIRIQRVDKNAGPEEPRERDPSGACLMEFNVTEWAVREDTEVVEIPVVRSGDLSVTCSVLCSTESESAEAGSDFDPRPLGAESSRLFFLRGVKVVHCPVTIKDDEFHEGEEHFMARLSQPQVELPGNTSASAALTGSKDQLIVRIRDEEDLTRVQFNQSVYRPGASTSSAFITVERLGDLRFASKVFLNALDGSAKEGQDYVIKSRRLDFNPHDQSASIQVNFPATTRSDWSKSFQLVLSPLESINAALTGGRSAATIFIPPAPSSGPALLPAEPIVMSLTDSGEVQQAEVLPGRPLVCVTPCEPKHPLYNGSTQRLCRNLAVDVPRIRFYWEISPSGDPFGAGVFQRLSQGTAFSGVEDRVLDPIYFGRDFRVRCVAQPVGSVVGPASISRTVTVSSETSLCPAFVPDSENGQQPFSASLAYVNASDPLHPDTMRIQVQVPHADGMIPVLSTHPLYGIRHVLTEPAYRSHHRCSNLHPGLGFLAGQNLYGHLDSKACLWTFQAWYTMTELVQLCGGQVTSSGYHQTAGNSGQVQVTVRVPLYVTLVSASPYGSGWTSVEHQTEMEFSFSYAPVLLGQRGMAESKLALAGHHHQPHVTRIRADPDNGRLVVDFQTETKFAGRYQSSGTRLISPAHLGHQLMGFEVEQTWSHTNPAGSTVQKWRAVSNVTLQDYTGNYTVTLVPCKPDCSLPGINVTLPIHFQQPLRPEPVHFALETTFQLTNDVKTFLRKPRSIGDIKVRSMTGHCIRGTNDDYGMKGSGIRRILPSG